MTNSSESISASVTIKVAADTTDSKQIEKSKLEIEWESATSSSANRTSSLYASTKPSELKLTLSDFKFKYKKLSDVIDANKGSINNVSTSSPNDENGTIDLIVDVTYEGKQVKLKTTLLGLAKTKNDQKILDEIVSKFDNATKIPSNTKFSGKDLLLPSKLDNKTLTDNFARWFPRLSTTLNNLRNYQVSVTKANDVDGSVEVSLKLNYQSSNAKELSATVKVSLSGFATTDTVLERTKTQLESQSYTVLGKNSIDPTASYFSNLNSLRENVKPLNDLMSKLSSNYGLTFDSATFVADTESGSIKATFKVAKDIINKSVTIAVSGFKATNDQSIVENFKTNLKLSGEAKDGYKDKLPSTVEITSLEQLNTVSDVNIKESDGIKIAISSSNHQNDDINGNKKVILTLTKNKASAQVEITITGFDSTSARNAEDEKVVDSAVESINKATAKIIEAKVSSGVDTVAKSWTSFELLKNDLSTDSSLTWDSDLKYEISKDANSIVANQSSGSISVKLKVSKGSVTKDATLTVIGFGFDWSQLVNKISALKVTSANQDHKDNFKRFWDQLKSNDTDITSLMEVLELQSGSNDLVSTFKGLSLVKDSLKAQLVTGATKELKNRSVNQFGGKFKTTIFL